MANRAPQRTVRAGQLDRTLDQMNDEIGRKVALSLERYHTEYIAPLEGRVEYLETSWWSRLWWRIGRSR